MRKAFLFMNLISLFFSCRAQKKTSAQNNLAGFIQQKGDSLLQAEKVPGIFVGILNKGKREYFSFGYAVPDEKNPFNAKTVFEAGSITKTFTAYLVESILREKEIPDTNSIVHYLPDSVQSNKALRSITFLSLLNHTSGLPRLPENMPLLPTDMDPYRNYTEHDLFAYLKTAQPKPDGKSNYSNLGMALAGVLAQRISGKDFAHLLADYVYTPFGIQGQNLTQVKSQGYFENEKVAFWKWNALAPAGCIHATAENMLTYLSRMSKPTDARSKAVIEQLLLPTTSLSPAVRIGKAWHTFEQKGKPAIYWHNGGTYGFSTFAAFVKDTEQAVIVVVNQFNKNAVSDGLGIAIMKKMLE